MNKKSYWLSISMFVLILIWTVYYYAMRYTGGFADLKDRVICGAVALICVAFIVKRTIDFLKNKKSCNYSAPRLGYINFWSKQRKYNFCFIIALLRKVDNFSM